MKTEITRRGLLKGLAALSVSAIVPIALAEQPSATEIVRRGAANGMISRLDVRVLDKIDLRGMGNLAFTDCTFRFPDSLSNTPVPDWFIRDEGQYLEITWCTFMADSFARSRGL